MKTLVCIDGGQRALTAVRLAAKLFCTDNDEATLLFVRRYRKDTRGYNIRRKATEVFSDWHKELPEMTYLHEAANLFEQVRDCHKSKVKADMLKRVFIHLGEGVFEEGRVRLPSNGATRLKIREGHPPDEIRREAEAGHYELVVLGARSTAGYYWYQVEHIPLEVARKAPRPVMVVATGFEEGQPVLVCTRERPLPETSLRLIQVIATRMKSKIQVLAVGITSEAASESSEKAASMVEKWRAHSLTVAWENLKGDPFTVIPKMAIHFGLIVCPPGRKKKRKRLDKLAKKLLCSSQFNVLVLR
ncbi:MAG: universal stress protein [Thermodesulfobacteriota bacterium]|nr:universal stress protein [Thermodesulfobacteriota bacterium]